MKYISKKQLLLSLLENQLILEDNNKVIIRAHNFEQCKFMAQDATKWQIAHSANTWKYQIDILLYAVYIIFDFDKIDTDQFMTKVIVRPDNDHLCVEDMNGDAITNGSYGNYVKYTEYSNYLQGVYQSSFNMPEQNILLKKYAKIQHNLSSRENLLASLEPNQLVFDDVANNIVIIQTSTFEQYKNISKDALFEPLKTLEAFMHKAASTYKEYIFIDFNRADNGGILYEVSINMLGKMPRPKYDRYKQYLCPKSIEEIKEVVDMNSFTNIEDIILSGYDNFTNIMGSKIDSLSSDTINLINSIIVDYMLECKTPYPRENVANTVTTGKYIRFMLDNLSKAIDKNNIFVAFVDVRSNLKALAQNQSDVLSVISTNISLDRYRSANDLFTCYVDIIDELDEIIGEYNTKWNLGYNLDQYFIDQVNAKMPAFKEPSCKI